MNIMLPVFKKNEESKYEFISTKEFILCLALFLGTTIFIPALIYAVYKPFEILIKTNIYLIFALLINVYIIYYVCCKKRNKTFFEGLFIIQKSKDVYLKSFFVGILMPILTAPLLITLAPSEFPGNKLNPQMIGIIIASALIIPVFEEIFFRGFLFPFFESKINSFWSIVFVGIIFGISHAPNVDNVGVVIALFIFYSFIITLVRYFTKSLIPSLITHMAHNITLIVGWMLIVYFKN